MTETTQHYATKRKREYNKGRLYRPVSFTLSDEQKSKLQKKAEYDGLNASEYMRKLIDNL